MRRSVVALLAACAVGSAHPAAATGYRYWTYWHGDARGWHFAAAGPYFTQLKTDPSVDGWRFASSDPYGPLPPVPKASPSYAALCHDLPRDGWVRLAIVIDFGIGTDTPPGDHLPNPPTYVACTMVPRGTNAFTALQDYAKVQIRADQSSFICGIAGYPRTECAGVNATAAPPPVDATPTPARPSTTASAPPKPTQSSMVTTLQPTSSTRTSPPVAATSPAAALGTPAPIAALDQPSSHGQWWPAAVGVLLVAALGLLTRARFRRR